jgi:hemerythrin-like domain-containing protein
VTVTPRRAADPEPDLLGITLGHRAILADVRRVAELTAAIGDGRESCPPARARALTRYVTLLCDSIHHHHTAEDEFLWPVIQASAGNVIDLTELVDDHAALDPKLDQLRARAAAFRVSGGDAKLAAVMAAELRELLELLTEHIADEERDVFPVIRQYVSVTDWNAVEKAARKGGQMSFDGPRTIAVMTDDERATLTELAGVGLRAMIALMSVPHRRLERKVFGANQPDSSRAASAANRSRNASAAKR